MKDHPGILNGEISSACRLVASSSGNSISNSINETPTHGTGNFESMAAWTPWLARPGPN